MDDNFGDRMKLYEAQECDRYLLPLTPIYARLDGRSFHSFTKGMERPYDEKFSDAMRELTRHLIVETGAIIGYTQSDEISLAWLHEDFRSEGIFNRRTFKLTSVLASMAAAKFACLVATNWPERASLYPHFDCRVYNLPNETELANCFLWRENDATKNAISMAAQSVFSHRELQGKNGSEMQEMLFQQHGINFNNYPAFFKRGTYLRRELREMELTEEEWLRIPESKRPPIGQSIQRHRIVDPHWPPLRGIANRCDVLFRQAAPFPNEKAEP